ncbi:MAG: T9SS type A sorting domain-containing protein [Bacteroidota bacterium]
MKLFVNLPIGSQHFYVLFLLCMASLTLPAQAIQTMIFEDDFNTGTLQPAWTPRPSMTGSNGVVEVVANEGIDGSGDFAVRMSKSGHPGGLVLNTLDLDLDLSAYPHVELIFWIEDYADETHFNDGISFSDDGGNTFVKVVDFHPSDWCTAYGQLPPIQVSKLAQEAGLNHLSSQFVIRFQQEGEQPYWSDGFYLDEVKVYVPDLVYFPLSSATPFADDFETGTLGNTWAHRSSELTAILQNGGPITRPSGLGEVLSGIGLDNSYGLALTKDCSDGPSTQSVDLHLNLAGLSGVELSFQIWASGDVTQIDDGIYFSDDGGLSFEKVFDFEPSDWCSQYGSFPPLDVDSLANQANLSLSDQFIIRFQQHGERWNHSIYFDEIEVYVSDYQHAELPFAEGFEQGTLRNMWKRPFADDHVVINTGEPVTRPSNLVEVISGFGNNSAYAVGLGKRCSDGLATVALDLLLDLQGQEEVRMSFWLRDMGEANHLDDGIYLSDDGGRNFVKLKSFDFENIPNFYAAYVLHLSDSMDQLGLQPTDSVIVRFQQHGDRYLGIDGFYLDDIEVIGTPTTGFLHPPRPTLQVYPNPAREWLNVPIPAGERLEALHLYDQTGQLVAMPPAEPQGQTLQLAVHHLPEGIYQLHFRTNSQTYQARFVKQ